MKTNFINSLLLVSLTVLVSLHVNSTISFFSGYSSSNEPAKKEIISLNNIDSPVTDFSFEGESYINDIPFNTKEVSDQTKYEEAMSVEFSFEDEEYIDDIVH